MTEYRLSKSNNNKLQKTDNKQKVVKAKKQKKDVVPVKKNYLAKVVNTSTDICVKSAKGLIKTTGHALTIVGNKLSQVDWGKLILKILTWLFATTPETDLKAQSYNQYETYTYYEKDYSKQERPRKANNSRPKTKSIKADKPKQVEGAKNKVIENKKSSKQIPKQRVRKISESKQQHLMIEKKDKKKAE
jgi:hypothetical protein